VVRLRRAALKFSLQADHLESVLRDNQPLLQLVQGQLADLLPGQDGPLIIGHQALVPTPGMRNTEPSAAS